MNPPTPLARRDGDVNLPRFVMRQDTLPSLENLRCFLAGAEQLNFRKASAVVHLTPAAFGSRIKQLESTLGCVLFVRSTRSVSLTLEGERLVPEAQDLVRQAMRCAQAIQTEEGWPVHLTVGTRFELGLSWLLPALLNLPDSLKHLECDLRFDSGDMLTEGLQKGRFDCMVTSKPQLEHTWQNEFLHQEEYSFVGSAKMLSEHPFHNAKDARTHTLIDIDNTLPLSRYLTSVLPQPLEFAKIRRFGTVAAIAQGVLAGVGVAVLPTYLVKTSLERGTMLKLLPQVALLSDSFRLIYPRNSLHRETMSQLASHLRGCPLK